MIETSKRNNQLLLKMFLSGIYNSLFMKKPLKPQNKDHIASTKSEQYKPSSTFNLSAVNSINDAIGTIDAKGMSIADIENELLKSDITDERRWQLKMQLEKLYYEQAEAYKKAINANPYQMKPPGADA